MEHRTAIIFGQYIKPFETYTFSLSLVDSKNIQTKMKYPF